MSGSFSMPGGRPDRGGPFSADEAGKFSDSGVRDEARDPKRGLIRVQIEALVSGDFTPMRVGPELVHRLNHAWSRAGQQLHLLHVEVVRTPLPCPRCGNHALYRAHRRGFLQLRVYPLLGMYPWNCLSCRQVSLLRLRTVEDPRARLSAHDRAERKRAA